jgi:hypothetical protein
MFESSDRVILRDLAMRVAEIAADDGMAARRRLWTEHNSLRPARPMILVFPEGSWPELLPAEALQCRGEAARGVEWGLRSRIYYFEHFRDDTVVEADWPVHRVVRSTGWGLEPRRIPSPTDRGAWHFDPVIHSPADLGKLHWPEISVDDEASQKTYQLFADLFGDILDVRLVGVKHVSYHIMAEYTVLRGLEEVMVDMYDNPGMLHDAMAFLTEGHRRVLRQYQDLNLLEFNHDNTYQNSGGNGFTDQLPQPDADPSRVRPRDMWGSAEAQEMAQVGPEQHEEFVLQYERQLLEPFGLTGYGCCEDLGRKLDRVLTIPNIRRISIAPSANVELCAPQLRDRRAVFSWKPNPSHLVGDFPEEELYRYIRHTVEVCARHDCALEMILKDTHTCENRPERFDRWTEVARAVVEDATG